VEPSVCFGVASWTMGIVSCDYDARMSWNGCAPGAFTRIRSIGFLVAQALLRGNYVCLRGSNGGEVPRAYSEGVTAL